MTQEARDAWASIDHERINYLPLFEFAQRLGVDLPESEIISRYNAVVSERVRQVRVGAVWMPRDPDDVFVEMLEAKLKEKPCYSQQRTWVGLTVEEIAACCMESTTTQLSFYNAIEAKLKEKNT